MEKQKILNWTYDNETWTHDLKIVDKEHKIEGDT